MEDEVWIQQNQKHKKNSMEGNELKEKAKKKNPNH